MKTETEDNTNKNNSTRTTNKCCAAEKQRGKTETLSEVKDKNIGEGKN